MRSRASSLARIASSQILVHTSDWIQNDLLRSGHAMATMHYTYVKRRCKCLGPTGDVRNVPGSCRKLLPICLSFILLTRPEVGNPWKHV